MVLFKIISASALFVLINVFIVTTGILSVEIFKRKEKRDVILLLIVLLGILGRIILDTWWDYAGRSDLILGLLGFSISVLLFIGIGIVFYLLWSKLNKKLTYFLISISTILFFTSFSLISKTPLIRVLPSKLFLFLLGSVFGFFQTLLVFSLCLVSYFLIINFLIDTTNVKIKRRNEK